jgi:hypothetical protein
VVYKIILSKQSLAQSLQVYKIILSKQSLAGARLIVNLGDWVDSDQQQQEQSQVPGHFVRRRHVAEEYISVRHMGLNMFADTVSKPRPQKPVALAPTEDVIQPWVRHVKYPPHMEAALERAQVVVTLHQVAGPTKRLLQMSYREYFHMVGMRKYLEALMDIYPALPIPGTLLVPSDDYEVILFYYKWFVILLLACNSTTHNLKFFDRLLLLSYVYAVRPDCNRTESLIHFCFSWRLMTLEIIYIHNWWT